MYMCCQLVPESTRPAEEPLSQGSFWSKLQNYFLPSRPGFYCNPLSRARMMILMLSTIRTSYRNFFLRSPLARARALSCSVQKVVWQGRPTDKVRKLWWRFLRQGKFRSFVFLWWAGLAAVLNPLETETRNTFHRDAVIKTNSVFSNTFS